jgi:hypothetical protein
MPLLPSLAPGLDYVEWFTGGWQRLEIWKLGNLELKESRPPYLSWFVAARGSSESVVAEGHVRH